MKAQFQDLGITGLIGERCYAVDGSILRIHLRLSKPPPLGWSFLFIQVWQKIEYPGKRPAGIESDAIWIECAPEEVRDCHLPQLEQALAQTNARYRAQYLKTEISAERQRELSRQTHMKLDELAQSFAPAHHTYQPSVETGGVPKNILGRILDFLQRKFTVPAKRSLKGQDTDGLGYWNVSRFRMLDFIPSRPRSKC